VYRIYQVNIDERYEKTMKLNDSCRYVLDIGHSEDWFALQIALLPCLLGYGVIARRLHDDPKTVREGNRYWKWIENYVAPDYTEAVQLGMGESNGERTALGRCADDS
jgi:thiaminase